MTLARLHETNRARWPWEDPEEVQPHKLPHRPRPKYPLDTEMTLCIGALAQHEREPCIVLCFDWKVANDFFGSESEYKLHRFSDQVVSLFADSPRRAKELALIYEAYLQTRPLTPKNALGTLREPLKILRHNLADHYVGRRLGVSYDELLSKGPTWQPYLDSIDKLPLQVQVIVAGFIGQFPLLCDNAHDDLEYATNASMIGTGAYLAEPALHARRCSRNDPLGSVVYYLFEAKRLAEASPYVGKLTTMLILEPPAKDEKKIGVSVVTQEGQNFLRELFNKYGPKPMAEYPELPSNAIQPAKF